MQKGRRPGCFPQQTLERNRRWVWLTFNLHFCKFHTQKSLPKIFARILTKIFLRKRRQRWLAWTCSWATKKAHEVGGKYDDFKSIWRIQTIRVSCPKHIIVRIEEILLKKWLQSTHKFHKANKNVPSDVISEAHDFGFSISSRERDHLRNKHAFVVLNEHIGIIFIFAIPPCPGISN